MDAKCFSVKMKEARSIQGMTQKELAQRANVAPATISSYENGTKTPTLENAISIAETLNLSLDELCGDKKNAYTTYSDVFNIMLFLIDHMGAIVANHEDGTHKNFSSLYFANNSTIAKMLENIRDIKKVLGKSKTEQELYELWKESKAKEYSQHNLFDDETFPGCIIINDPDSHSSF